MQKLTKTFIRRDLQLSPEWEYDCGGSGVLRVGKTYEDIEYRFYELILWCIENCIFTAIVNYTSKFGGIMEITLKYSGMGVKGDCIFNIQETIKDKHTGRDRVTETSKHIYTLLKENTNGFTLL